MSNKFEYDVFFSYSSKDKEIVHDLANHLKQAGLRVWLDEWAIKPGDSIPLKIQAGLEQSRTLLMCMSPSYFGSEWGMVEHHTLIFRDPTNANRRFIPLLIKDCTPPDIIKQFAYIDWRTPSDSSYDKILESFQEKKEEKTNPKRKGWQSSKCNHRDSLIDSGFNHMPNTTPIRILEKDANRRGDLFGRLMADLFVALGYEQPRLNIHKSGRELDLSADHRLEPRRAIGECKATSEPIGGDDLNKFVGALDAEQDDGKHPITGYFISLNGFKETAIEQEMQRRTRIVTLTGLQVISELVNGRILITKDKATELAGRCCAYLSDLILDPEAELLAHERGWIWAIYYTQGKARTHFVLIHSDGTLLARLIAEEVIAADHDCYGGLEKLICLNPEPLTGTDADPCVAEALAAYCKYIDSECGYIQLDGLPADSDVGSRRLRLENLFVPLHLDVTVNAGQEYSKKKRKTVGVVLAEHPRLALLASPGGGKSTLVKRLAVAYADPARREQIDDNLPQRDWLPLFFRCRELRGLARGSFAELLEALSQREPVRQHAAAFRAYVDRALLANRVLLLVDGLDEISDPGDRAAFVCTLRTALQAYPGIAIVVTSREAGFRHVAAHLAPVCTHAALSSFDENDILRLSVAWHKEVVGDTEKVRTDAEQLATTITKNDRIKALAVNPLLFTTLLLVKRWVGSLPPRRAVLYGKAIEVLLMTWNTEGHEPIPEEEALPQLCYVASAMMFDGVQKISRFKLTALLQDARSAMPTELGYVTDTVDQFVRRIEDRSSLLQMAGHDVEDGRLVEFFEFRHLTFQEFLTAKAMVEGWHRDAKETDTLASVLEPYFEKEQWREVIPLAAVMGGKATETLIKSITKNVSSKVSLHTGKWIQAKMPPQYLVLCNCLADEAAARPETIRAAIRELVQRGRYLHYQKTTTKLLARSRYGKDFREEAGKALHEWEADLANVGNALAIAIYWQVVHIEDADEWTKAADRIINMMRSSDHVTRCEGILGLMFLCFEIRDNPDAIAACTKALQSAGEILIVTLNSEHFYYQFVSSWALVWLGACRVWLPPAKPDVLGRLFSLWRQNPNASVNRMACWAIACQSVQSRDNMNYFSTIPFENFQDLLNTFVQLDNKHEKVAVLVIAWYLRALEDKELIVGARNLLNLNEMLRRGNSRFNDKEMTVAAEDSANLDEKIRLKIGRSNDQWTLIELLHHLGVDIHVKWD